MMQFPGYGYKKYINRLTIRQSVKAESDQTCPFQAIRPCRFVQQFDRWEGWTLTESRLKALTVIHNHGLRREDGTTAAERLFGT